MLLSVLQDTPNTVGYLILGYSFFIGLPALYILSLVVRRRNLERDIELARLLAEEETPAASSSDPAASSRPNPAH